MAFITTNVDFCRILIKYYFNFNGMNKVRQGILSRATISDNGRNKTTVVFTFKISLRTNNSSKK